MGTRYNVSHIPEADVKEAWANYSKYSYYYSTEIEKAKETLKSTLSTARSRLIARGITEDNPQFQREMDRITNIARADMSALQAGQQSLETGAISDLLLSGQITKYSAGNYGAYTRGVFEARQVLGQERLREGEADPYARFTEGILALDATKPGTESPTLTPWERYEPDTSRTDTDPQTYYVRRDESGKIVSRLDESTYTKYTERAGQELMSMQDYYTGIWGAYDPHFDVRKGQEAKAEESARGKAGSRAYTIQVQPKGLPGGGKPGNPFMQTGREVASELAPQEEREKAWWA